MAEQSPDSTAHAATADLRIGVLHVVITFCPGGGERAAIEIATRLSDRFRVTACCLDQPGPWASKLTDRGIPVLALGRLPGFRPSLALRIANIAAKHKIHVLHCHQYSPYVYGSLAALVRAGLRVVVTEQGRLSDAPPSRKRKIANLWLGRIPRRVFAVSTDLRAHLIEEGFPAHKVEVLYNSIDPGPAVTAVDRQQIREALRIARDRYVVGTVARLDPVKDLSTLVRAFHLVREALPNPLLVIVGDGPESDLLQALVREHGLEPGVRFTGHRDDARRILGAFDQYVNCSTTEGTSLTIMEAMAASLPVVATNVGGTAEIVIDGVTGVLVPAQRPEALADAIRAISRLPDLGASLGVAGRARVEEHFSVDRMVARYAQSYLE